jgi:hexosaminidase
LIVSTLNYAQYALVPKPKKLIYGTGSYALNEVLVINTASIFENEVQLFSSYLKTFCNKTLTVAKSMEDTSNLIIKEDKSLQTNVYHIIVNGKGIQITASSQAAMFYGIQTLIQMIQSSHNGELSYCEIEDSPDFSWRGMHLDVSRHFMSIDDVKKYIDYLAMYKMNVFHWHLTEDQGWRIEIKKYPKLISVGAFRKRSMTGKYSEGKYKEEIHGGFYTQDQIKDVVQYAQKRHITIVPEIEMPGHALAALASYPQLACFPDSFAVAEKWGVFEDVFCAGNEDVFQFLENILTEVIALFPGQYLHIGGDECPKERWKKCSKCQTRILKEKLKDEHELQSYFIRRIEKFIEKKGKNLIGWDEILEGGLAPNAAVMSWRGEAGGIAAAKAGHYVVMSPGSPCYFDHYQHQNKEKEPVAIGGYNPLSKVYNYQPIPNVLNKDEEKFVLGAQGNVWTEYMPNFKQVEYMALPRMAALAERLWQSGSQTTNFEDFKYRLKIQVKMLDRLNVNYCKHFVFDVE